MPSGVASGFDAGWSAHLVGSSEVGSRACSILAEQLRLAGRAGLLEVAELLEPDRVEAVVGGQVVERDVVVVVGATEAAPPVGEEPEERPGRVAEQPPVVETLVAEAADERVRREQRAPPRRLGRARQPSPSTSARGPGTRR